MTFLTVLFFVAYASPVLFCAGSERFARAPVDEREDEALAGWQFARLIRQSPVPKKESGIAGPLNAHVS
jgi:hypothetical protein